MERCFFGAQSFGALPLAEWLRYHCPQPPRCNFLQSFFGVLRSDTQYSVSQRPLSTRAAVMFVSTLGALLCNLAGGFAPLRKPHIRAPCQPWKTSDERQDCTLVKPCLLRRSGEYLRVPFAPRRAADLMPTEEEISLNPPLIPPKNTIIYKHLHLNKY